MKYNTDTLANIRKESVYALAGRADCSVNTPEAEEFLDRIRTTVLEQIDYTDPEDWEREFVEDYSGRATEIADNAPNPYTHPMWAEFLGTCAWQVDLDYEEPAQADIEQRARLRLFSIALALVGSLATDIAVSITDNEEVTV